MEGSGMALRATLAVFAAAITLLLAGPIALQVSDALMAGRSVSLAEVLGLNSAASPVLVAFGFALGTLASAALLVAVWLPVHALLEAAGLRGFGMYAAAGYTAGGLAGALLAGPFSLGDYPMVTLIVAGATAGALCASVFWLVRRPDND
jgi:hypothetical protein